MKLRHHRLVINKSVLLCGAAMGASGFLYVFSNKLTTAAAAIILEYTAPVFIILFTAIFFRKKPDKLDITVIPIIVVGILCFFFDSLTASSSAPNPLLGNIIGIFSGMAYAVVFMMKLIPGSDNLSAVFTGCVIGAIIGFPAFVTELTTPEHVSVTVLGMVLLLGVVQFGTSYICMAEGLEHTPPFAASLISTVEPILNPLLAAAFLKETIGSITLVGAVIVIGTILGYNLLKDRQETEKLKSSKE